MIWAKIIVTGIGAIAGSASVRELLPPEYQPIAQTLFALCVSLGALFVQPPKGVDYVE